MHSALVSMGRDSDILVCVQRRNWRRFFGSIYELGIATEFLYWNPSVSSRASGTPRTQRQRRSESTRVWMILASYSIYLIVMMSWFTLRLCSIMTSWCREGSCRDVRSRAKIYVKICEAQRLITTCPSKTIVMMPAVIWPTFSATSCTYRVEKVAMVTLRVTGNPHGA